MNKTELVAAVAAKTGQTKKSAEESIAATLHVITGELAKGGTVQLIGFGTFAVKNRAARTTRNPRTGEPIQLPALKAPAFKAGKALKDAVRD